MTFFSIVLSAAYFVTGSSEPVVSVPEPKSAPVPSLASAVQDAEEGLDAVEDEKAAWTGSVNLGFSRSEGNADVENHSLDARAIREFEEHRYTLEGLWYISRDNDQGGFLQRRALGSAKYDQFLSKTVYAYVQGLAETNLRANLDLRWTVGVGIGKQWRDDEYWRISAEVGVSYFDETFDDDTDTDYIAARAAWDVWARVNETVEFGHLGEVFPSLEDIEDFYGRTTTYLQAQLSSSLTARLSWLLTFDNTPASVGGSSLERADNVYLLTIGWVF